MFTATLSSGVADSYTDFGDGSAADVRRGHGVLSVRRAGGVHVIVTATNALNSVTGTARISVLAPPEPAVGLR